MDLPAIAEVRVLELPRNCVDFSLQPATGDVAALPAGANQLLIFRAADLADGKRDASLTVPLGESPAAVCFKQFGDTAMFAVVCQGAPHMYLINPKDGALLRKVALADNGAVHVVTSSNPNDPFLYYTLKTDRHAKTNAVSVRDMQDKGQVFVEALDCAVFASGQVIYRRSDNNPWTFESYSLFNLFTGERPVLRRLHYDRFITAPYVPDTFDQFTAMGNRIYGRSLEKKLARLDFAPRCWFSKRPVLIGAEDIDGGFRQQRRKPESARTVLCAASANSFQPIGIAVALDGKPVVPEKKKPRDVADDDEDDRSGRDRPPLPRYFADDARDQVIVADAGRIYFVPLADFQLPTEPILQATLTGGDDLQVGKESTLVAKSAEAETKLSFDALPEGVQANGQQLKWKPTADQVGPTKINLVLRRGDFERSMTFEVNVRYPSVDLPFEATGVSIRSDGKQVLLWDKYTEDRFLERNNRELHRAAVVDLATGRVVAEKKLAASAYGAVITADYVVMHNDPGSPRIDVLNASTLERAKSLAAAAPIINVQAEGKLLALNTAQGGELYELGTFNRIASVERGGGRQDRDESLAVAFTPGGVRMRDMLLDDELKPFLVYEAGHLPQVGRADTRWRPYRAAESLYERLTPNDVRIGLEQGGRYRMATAIAPNGRSLVAVDLRITRNTSNRRAILSQIEVLVNAAGDATGGQVLLSEMRSAEDDPSRPMAGLRVTADEAMVTYKGKLYRWPLPRSTLDSALTFAQRQSALALSGTGKIVLQHSASGGQQPRTFHLVSSLDGVSINEQTGNVTLNEAVVLAQAQQSLEKFLVEDRRVGPYVDRLRLHAPEMMARAEQILGRKPKGVPMAVPICVDVTDKEGASDRLQYFVVAELPSAAVFARLKELYEAHQPKKEAPVPAEGNDDEIAAINKRLDALERRLETMSRQLNLVLNRLEH